MSRIKAVIRSTIQELIFPKLYFLIPFSIFHQYKLKYILNFSYRIIYRQSILTAPNAYNIFRFQAKFVYQIHEKRELIIFILKFLNYSRLRSSCL